MTELDEREEALRALIEDSVEEAVGRAFRKHGGGGAGRAALRRGAAALLLVLLAAAGVWMYRERKSAASEPVPPVESHDVTLENNGLFGFTVEDFQRPVLGEGARQSLLIVEERDAFVNTTLTETGLLQLGIFNKKQVLTIHGTGQYTIDLTEITAEDISLDEGTYTLTIRIPHAVLHSVSFDPEKTEIGDTQNGWLAFGSIELDAEQQKQFETEAQNELTRSLIQPECFEEADRFALLCAGELYQPVVNAVSPAYKVSIEFQE